MKLSVVIPTLDEAANISLLLERLSETPGIYEVVVADGRSAVVTPNILRSSMYRLVLGEPGRGIQFRVGLEKQRETSSCSFCTTTSGRPWMRPRR